MSRSPLSRLQPKVLAFVTPSFELRNDLERLLDVREAGASEAVIFYASRILEALTAESMRRLGQSPSANVFANLEALEHWNRFGVGTRSWAHALRRLGNTVRHLWGHVGAADASLAAVFAEGWLAWFFCEFSHGCRLDHLTGDRGPIGLSGRDELVVWMRSLDSVGDTPPCDLPTPV